MFFRASNAQVEKKMQFAKRSSAIFEGSIQNYAEKTFAQATTRFISNIIILTGVFKSQL